MTNTLNPQRVIDDLNELRRLTGDNDGAQRVAWTATWQRARTLLRQRLAGLPVTVEEDAAGNLWATLAGASAQTLLIGGHLDSVPNGGWLDGCLNVLAGLEVLRRLARQYPDGTLPITVCLVDWADEEGARFGRSLFGSSAAGGNMNPDLLRDLQDKDGIRLQDALLECGVDIDKAHLAQHKLQNAAAYLELHIEQGPVLEQLGLPLGAVLGTKGVERHRIVFTGQEAHSGATPMTMRRDALGAAAKLALEIREIAKKRQDAVCTVGSLKTLPGIVTAVVGRAEMTLDQRDLDAGVLAAMLSEAKAASEKFAIEENVGVEWSKIWSIEPIPFHPRLIELCEQACAEVSGHSPSLPSGPLHDAAEVARAGIPTVMLFVQSLRGISHNKIEDTELEHLKMSVEALDKLTDKTIAWILG
jgi:beta-ureidopropionase / N-carbamoyl-L-amino-acid hydrolase